VASLLATSEALWRGYDLLVLDLDGVVYRGPSALPHVPERLDRLRQQGGRLAFVTNNASRTPATVAAHLRRLQVDAAETDVVTAAQAAARVVARLVPAGSRVLVVGGDGLRQAVAEHGLVHVHSAADAPAAVVQGFAPEVGWSMLAEGAYAVAAGAVWVATNLDRTVPTDRGIAPGNGTLVAAVAAAAQRQPQVAGKPEPALFDETLLRVGGSHPLVVGDRLDTDVAAANRVGADSLLVLTGVTDLDLLAAASPDQRPTFVAADLGGLETTHPRVDAAGEGVSCGRWRAVPAAQVEVTPRAKEPRDPQQDVTDLLRAAVSAAWRHLDAGGGPARMNAVTAAMREMMQSPAGAGQDERRDG